MEREGYLPGDLTGWRLTPLGRQMVHDNRGLAYRMARAGVVGPRDPDERLSVAFEGLAAAVARFRPDLGHRFSTFACWTIRGYLLTAARRGRVIAQPQHPPRSELARERAYLAGHTASLDALDSEPWAGPEEPEEPDPEVGRLIDVLASLEPRMQVILRCRYADPPETLREIGERLGITKERVRQLEGKARDRLRELMAVRP